MARFRDVLSAFLAGEISPRLHNRTDVEQFKQACEEITNMFVYPQGGAARRPGTLFVSDDAGFVGEEAVRIIPFIKSKTESYIIIFTTNTGTDKGLLIWDITNEVFKNISTGHYETYSGFDYFSAWTGFTTAQQLEEIQYKSFGNAIFFAQKDHPPFALDFALVSGSFPVTEFPFWAYSTIGQRTAFGDLIDPSVYDQTADAWPYMDSNVEPTNTIAASGTTGSVTLTSTLGVFDTSHIGSLIRVTGDSALTTGVAVIGVVSAPETATAFIIKDFEDTNPASTWAFSSWSDLNGWPKAITFFENRIGYGFTAVEPNGFWFSKIGDLSYLRQEPYIQDIISDPITNDSAWSNRIPGGESSVIQWLSAKKTLFVGSLGGEIVGYGPDTSIAMGPLNFNFSQETSYGSSQVQPINRDSVFIFVQRSGRMIREPKFNFDENAYQAPRIMKLAEHMPRKTQDLVEDSASPISNGQIVEMAHCEADNQITWFRDSNGGIFAMSRDRDEEGQPTAFHYHQISGYTEDTPGAQILSICAAPSADGTHDDLYLIVRRNMTSGPRKTYLEKIGRDFEGKTIYDAAFTEVTDKPIYLDSAKLHISGTVDLVHAGFDHLYQTIRSSTSDLETVQVIADGHYVGEKEVSAAGEITLSVAAREVIAGLPYRSQIIPVQVNMGSQLGSAQGADKTLDQVFVNFVATIGGKFGAAFNGVVDEAQMLDIEFRDPNANQNDPIDLFTGTKEFSPPLGWAPKMNVVIRQDLPFPQHVTSIVFRGLTND
jgi:hypothetical protein